MKRKFLLSAFLVFSTLFAVACGGEQSVEESGGGSSGGTPSVNATLNDRLKDATGEVTLLLDKGSKIECSEGQTVLGGTGATTITITAENRNTIVTVDGVAQSPVKAVDSATLVFKNITLVDWTPDNYSAWKNYLYLGGKLRFENCLIMDSIYLTDDADATFINCEIRSTVSGRYSAWVADGSASFENCTFRGCRGMKIHEFEGDDVVNVAVTNCIFKDITEKPGIAIGSIVADAPNTTISISYCTFDNCQEWDTVGSLAGVNGAYETDTQISQFNFIYQHNTVLS